MVCVNPDRFAHEGNPLQAVVRQGSIVGMHERQGGQVFYIGKPSDKMYIAAMKYFHDFGISRPQKILMVGDTPETDVLGANNFGMPSALVIKTGIMADRIAHHSLEGAFQNLQMNERPNFCINYMGKMNFKLHPNLAKKDFLIDLPLCRVLLENESHYPWIFLLPRRSNYVANYGLGGS